MPHDYVLYGHRLRTDFPLLGLVPAEQVAPPDVKISFQDAPLKGASWSVIDYIQDPGSALYTRSVWDSPAGRYHRLRFEDDLGSTAYIISPDGRQIWVAFTEGVILEEMIAGLLAQILARALRLQGVLCLHAGVVAVGEVAVALVGPKGTGKSTTTAALARLGYPVLSDDMGVLTWDEAEVLVHPGLPHLRLRPDAAAHLYGDSEAVPALWARQEQRIDKRRLDLDHYELGFAAHALPLLAIYLLETDDEANTPAVLPLEAAAAFPHLAPHTYVSDVLDASGRGREFKALGRLVRLVPVKRLRRPPSLEALPQICEVLLEDVRLAS